MVNRSGTLKELATASKRRWRLPYILSWTGLYVGLLLVTALFSLLIWWSGGEVKKFLGPDNRRVIAAHAAIPAAVALGMTIIMISGGIDLSVGYVVSLVTVLM